MSYVKVTPLFDMDISMHPPHKKYFIYAIITLTALAFSSFFFVERNTEQHYVFISNDDLTFELPSFTPQISKETLAFDEIKTLVSPTSELMSKLETPSKTDNKSVGSPSQNTHTMENINDKKTTTPETIMAQLRQEVETYVNADIDESLLRYPYTYSHISDINCHHKACQITVDNALYVEEKIKNNAVIKVKTYKLKIGRNCAQQKRQSYNDLPADALIGEFAVRYRCVKPV
jgi:hypothetical protein